MPPGHLWGSVLGMSQQEKAQGRSRTHWRNYVSCLGWECLGISLKELEEVSEHLCIDCCSHDLAPDKWKKMNGNF